MNLKVLAEHIVISKGKIADHQTVGLGCLA